MGSERTARNAARKVAEVKIDPDTGEIETKFTGPWVGRDVYAALRALERGYRRYVASRRLSETK